MIWDSNKVIIITAEDYSHLGELYLHQSNCNTNTLYPLAQVSRDYFVQRMSVSPGFVVFCVKCSSFPAKKVSIKYR